VDQKEFTLLTGTCDDILNMFPDNYPVTAVSWLHVLSVHPNNLQYYQYASKPRSFFSACRILLYNSAYIGYKLIKSLLGPNVNEKSLPIHADILFISHLVNADLPLGTQDFYFGQIPYLTETRKGYTSVTGMIDHTPGDKTKEQRAALENDITVKYVFPKTQLFRKELELIGQCISTYRLLLRKRKTETDPLRRTILREAAFQALAPETFYTLRIYESIKTLIERLRPADLVITWEGRAWERLAIYAAKNAGFPVHCIGYQHTILLSSSYSIKRSLGKVFDADLIFTLGNISRKILEERLKFTTCKSYGSYRLVLPESVQMKKSDKIICLVTPEGLEQECIYLFDFAVEMAKKMPQISFVFRMHPILPYNKFAEKHKEFLSLPANCQVSEFPSMNDDLKRCNFLLYRASSVALYAVINGLKPVYCGREDEMPIDSLYFLGNWRAVVKNRQEFMQVIETYQQMPEAEKEQEFASALSLCREYVTVPAEEIFINSFVPLSKL